MRLGLAVLALLLLAPSARAQKAIFLVRHAERADSSDDTALSPAGVQRAQRLADLLRDAGITAAFATQFRRTYETARPLVERSKIPLERLPDRDVAGLVDKLRTAHARDIVFVAAHAHTIPEILRRLGVVAKVSIGNDEYDQLFVIVPVPTGPPVVSRLHY